MEFSFNPSALMGIFSAIILGSFTVLLLLVLIKWCLCSFCGTAIVRRNVVYDRNRVMLRIATYDRSAVSEVIEDKSGLPTYEEAIRMNKFVQPTLDTPSHAIVIHPPKLES